MAIGINDLDDDDFLELNPDKQDDNGLNNYYNQVDDDSFMSDFLKSKGIDDPSRIKFEDDNGSIVERSWNDLTREELMNIANTPLEEYNYNEDYDLNGEEINLINLIRKSGMSPEQYLETIKGEQLILQPTYKVDLLSDDELFLLDLESRIGEELTDEEAAQQLATAKQNEDFFQKQINGIRREYLERENLDEMLQQAEIEENQKKAFDYYSSEVISAIDLFASIGNLDLNLEDTDKEELALFMLSKDDNGINYLYLALQDPLTLVKAAWFILNGEEAFNSVSDYFANLIKLVSENLYKKGLEEGRNNKLSQSKLIIDNSNKNNNQHRIYNSINDLDDED